MTQKRHTAHLSRWLSPAIASVDSVSPANGISVRSSFAKAHKHSPADGGKARRTGSQLVAGDLQPTNQAAADGDGSCAKNGPEHSRSSAGAANLSGEKRFFSRFVSGASRHPCSSSNPAGRRRRACRKPGRQTARVGAPSKQNEGPDQQAHSEGPKPQGAG